MAGEAAASSAEVEDALATPAEPEVAAFFDVDNTLMQGASIFHLARGLYRRRFFTSREIASAAWKQAKFRVVGSEDPAHVADAQASALAFIEGHTVLELEQLGEEIFDEAMATRIWPGTRALAQLHLDQGQRVWLVTAAPIEIAGIIAGGSASPARSAPSPSTSTASTPVAWSAACCTAPRRRRRSRPSRSGRGSTSPAARRTRTRPTTCRC
jgi:hypothetical protein